MQTQVLCSGMSLMVMYSNILLCLSTLQNKENSDNMTINCKLQYSFLFSFCFTHEQSCRIVSPFFFSLVLNDVKRIYFFCHLIYLSFIFIMFAFKITRFLLVCCSPFPPDKHNIKVKCYCSSHMAILSFGCIGAV